MRRRLLILLTLAVSGTAVAGYLTLRRDGQYRTFLAVGDDAVGREDAFGAIEAFSGAIALRPGSMLAWLKRGEVYLNRGDYRSALRDLRRASTLDPAALRPLELLGDAEGALDRPTRAAEAYEAYLKLDDRDARVFYKLALARLYEDRPDVALSAATRAIRLDDRLAEAHYVLGLALADLARPREATRALERAIGLAPGMTAVRQALAERYRASGRTADEVRQREALAALDPARSAHHVAIADAWTRAGRTDLAISALARALERFGNDPALLTALGRVWLSAYESQGDRVSLSKAHEALRRSVAASPMAGALSLLGRAQLFAGDLTGALRSLQQGTATVPVSLRTLGDLSVVAERQGRHALARDALIRQAALAGESGAPRARADRAARIATLCQRLGDREGAVHWLARAVDAAPDDRTLATRLAALGAS